jgi:hypothetical protein
LDGEWNSDTRKYKYKQEINQAQYLEALDDCFFVNSEYLPEVVIMDQATKASILVDMAKAMAMANGEDEVSVLSQLTYKTLNEANTHPRQGASSSALPITSAQSGNASKSKIQAAVRVSIEHNRAMVCL